jgi:hypothetical protein
VGSLATDGLGQAWLFCLISRDLKLEQVILDRLAHCNFNDVPQPKPVTGP